MSLQQTEGLSSPLHTPNHVFKQDSFPPVLFRFLETQKLQLFKFAEYLRGLGLPRGCGAAEGQGTRRVGAAAF